MFHRDILLTWALRMFPNPAPQPSFDLPRLEGLKFSAAHFVAFHGFREPMHGHNYTVGARIGARQLQPDGYVIDFGDVKKVLRQICKRRPWRPWFMSLDSHSPVDWLVGTLVVIC